ncbi:MAG: ATP-binding protein [Clostridia bacterium]|nr:ATP-binding protein [Clostridia bacterium]
MLYRKTYKKIDEWYKSNHMALLIDGARQVGKTTLIENYLNDNNIDYVEFNLLTNKDAYDAFVSSTNYDQLIFRLQSLAKKDITNGSTLVFIDEVQAPKDAITIIKELVINTKTKFIFSGSLLGIKLSNIDSIPAGYLKIINMYPMDFEEFLMASNVTTKTLDHIKDCFNNLKPVDDIIHKQLLDLFNVYIIVGGYPKAVVKYLETKNLSKVYDEIEDIDRAYSEDVSKYAKEDKLLIKDIYELIPSELSTQNKRFILKNLNEKERFYQSEKSFVWLMDSSIGLFCYNVSDIKYPLLASKSRTLFKLFLCDTGLLSYKLFGNDAIKIVNGKVNVNNGAIYENVVAKELTAHGYKLYYNNDKKRGEIDFLIDDDTKIIPIEVKSGKDYKRHSALENILSDSNNNIDKAYVFSNGNVEVNKNKIYLPIYMIYLIQKEKNHLDTLIDIDISNL